MGRPLLLLLWLWIGSAAPGLAEERIRIAIGEWPPLIGAELPGYGVVPRLISEVFAAEGITVEYGFFPWKRSYQQVKQGRWHASAIWGRTPEREADCLFSEVVYSDELVLYYHRDHPVAWDGTLAGAEALRGLTIGIALGSAKAPVLEQAEQRGWIRYESGSDELVNLRKLAARRIAAVDIAKGTGRYLLLQRLSPAEREVLRHTEPYQRWDYHLIFSRQLKENRHYLALFDRGLRRLKADGRYAVLWDEFYRDGR
jgi:polar amino acid transport system substrate-binding protein